MPAGTDQASELFQVLHAGVDENELWKGDSDYKAHQLEHLHKLKQEELKKRLDKRIGNNMNVEGLHELHALRRRVTNPRKSILSGHVGTFQDGKVAPSPKASPRLPLTIAASPREPATATVPLVPDDDAAATAVAVVPATAGELAPVKEEDKEEVINPYEEYLPSGVEFNSLGPVRRVAIKICSNPDFELLVTFIIFANCLTLTLYDPMQPDNSYHNMILFWIGG